MRAALVLVLLLALPAVASAERPRGQVLIGACSTVPTHLYEAPTIWKLNTRTGRIRLLDVTDYAGYTLGLCQPPHPRWSPDGRRYAFGGFTNLYVRTPSERRPRVVAEGSPPFEWTPDGDSLTVARLTGSGDALSRLVELPLDGGRARPVTGRLELRSNTFPWSPDGRFAYYTRNDAPGRPVAVARTRRDRAGKRQITTGVLLAMAPDGHRLLVEDRHTPGVWIVRAEPDGARRRLLPLHSTGFMHAAAWSPDGRWIVLVGVVRTGDPVNFRLIRADGRVQHPLRLPEGIGMVTSLSWRPPQR